MGNLMKVIFLFASWALQIAAAAASFVILLTSQLFSLSVLSKVEIGHSGWDRFYLSGRLQKPVNVIVDNLEIKKLNSANLKAAASAALLLLPSEFSEEELYAKICSLSYMGDLRMLFAEDKNKVKKIVQGQFKLFQTMYRPILEEFAARDCFRLSSSVDQKVNIIQDCGLSTACSLVSSLPLPLRNQMGIKLGEKKVFDESGRAVRKVVIKSKEEAADCMRKILRQKVMVSSARQAVAGLLTVGVVHGLRYVGSKMHKAWKSWWSNDAKKFVDLPKQSENNMKHCLNWWDLTWFGFGSVICAGIFVLTGQEAHDHAGPAIVLSHIVSGISSMLSVFCYTEFTVEIPVAGESFAYLRVELGDLATFITGNILLESFVGSAAVARSWTSYFTTLLDRHPESLRLRTNLKDGFNLLDPIVVAVLAIASMIVMTIAKQLPT
ncbi:UNVERIFIED_CONTAM: Cationic amino acid transporter 5 [Sesamum calycinum]|uniref:Phosphatidate cytidylyltransferase, mitochondrial n=1 Tax=Sesamum calycinum TaxID=2727403 RepID=A0AAW2Q796_9LAMI